MRRTLLAALCAAVVLALLVSVASLVPKQEARPQCKVYDGPKQVYREIDAGTKRKPPGTPGGGKPGKPGKPGGSGPQPDPSVDKWAVVIGISNYRGKMNDLQYCATTLWTCTTTF